MQPLLTWLPQHALKYVWSRQRAPINRNPQRQEIGRVNHRPICPGSAFRWRNQTKTQRKLTRASRPKPIAYTKAMRNTHLATNPNTFLRPPKILRNQQDLKGSMIHHLSHSNMTHNCCPNQPISRERDRAETACPTTKGKLGGTEILHIY